MATSSSSNSTPIDLNSITSIVSSLQRAVADFYGPQCTQTLLTSKTGKAVVTSDGLCILDALQPAHPIAEVVFNAVKSCHSVTLDGSKVFLLYLSNFLLHLQEEVVMGRFSHGGSNLRGGEASSERLGMLCAKKCVSQLKQFVLPYALEELKQHSNSLIESMLQRSCETDLMKCVLKTALMPHYNPKLCEHLASILISSLPISAGPDFHTSLFQALQLFVDKFNYLTIKVANQPYGENTVHDLFLLNRKLTLKCDNLCNLKGIKALIVNECTDTDSDDEHKETFSVKCADQIIQLLQQRRRKIELLASKLQSKNINLLISTESLPDYALEILRRHKISAIVHVAEEDVELLERLTQKMSLSNTTDEIDDNNIIHLSGIQELVIGGKEYVHLDLKNITYRIKHLLVCAPTVGLCDQVAVALQKALNALKMCFHHEVSIGTLNVKHKMKVKDSLINCTDYKVDDFDKLNEEREGKDEAAVARETLHNDLVKNKLSPRESIENKCRQNYTLSKEAGFSTKLNIVAEVPNVKEFDYEIESLDLQRTNSYTREYENNQRYKFKLVEGGGCFELLMARYLQNFSRNCADSNLKTTCLVLEKTMVSVVQKLFENATLLPENKGKFIEVRTKLSDILSEGQVWGLSRRGLPSNLAEKGVVEPLQSKIHILYCVLDLIEQVLGIDKIVSVRRPSPID